MINGDGRTSYTAQAYVRANSGINSFAQLKGKRACHTGFLKSAGMYVTLISYSSFFARVYGARMTTAGCSPDWPFAIQVHAYWIWCPQRIH
jgi:hypothetical protein